MRCWANQFSRGGNNLQGECLYRLGENQQQATFKHLLQTDPNLSIEPLHGYDQTALFVVPFPLPLSSQESGRFSVPSQTCSLLVRREGGGGGQERLGKRRADKRGQGEGSTRLDYFYTRHADLLGADLEPRSSLLVFP